ncbi:similar to Saccharomyces cerevisiae YNR012W URK1 Uridine/cytidine kinase, component of the pyrimidine ribonucleotide salvage pathway that converts uridine into UMP and cytidine into CMP [Maudiozyma saulgeensis]|uniref:Uridine kinase n=1 Tax=Maudiozyma saulgeensis TaxID=1789683 RepID=A0A1X7R7I5_9SACH|nr:similar to Saccharomyces cerevisiae YNR012W URK1 Uridine/cytidine kinase, component of the pyrimidine ribonucleotide salvage pathway that converts uridine into UMP and cytidine into CMP [Kazachstania saulgeensis]
MSSTAVEEYLSPPSSPNRTNHQKKRKTRRSSGNSMMSYDRRNPKYVPPWTTPYIIGVGGPSGSGKTSVASKIVSMINVPWTVLISLDNFYKPLTAEESERAFKSEYDFDEPAAIDLDLAYKCISSLKEGKKTDIPIYSFVNHNRVPGKTIPIYGASVVILEGIYGLYDEKLLNLMDIKIYVDADLDVCLARRLSRDIVSRGRDLHGCIDQWERFVKPNAVKYVKPTMKNADAIIPSMGENTIAVTLLVDHIKSRLDLKSEKHIMELNRLCEISSGHKYITFASNPKVIELEQTHQVKAILTMIVDKDCDRDSFVFFVDRFAMILLSKALDNVPVHKQESLTTASNYHIQNALRCNFDRITSVSLIRSGDCFMKSVRKTIPNITIGKLLIQSDSLTGEPQLHGEFLPKDIAKFQNLLVLQGQVITGTSTLMAIQVLLDYGVKLEHMTLVVFLATEIGLKRIINAFGNKIAIIVGKIIMNQDMKESHMKWASSRFIDTKYFGCK